MTDSIGTLRRQSRWFKVSAILFWWSWAGFVLYLFRYGSSYVLFWSLLLSQFTILGLQIVYVKGPCRLRFAHLEVVASFVALQLLSVASAGSNNLYWLDSYYELRATIEVLKNGWSPSLNLLGSVSGYPLVHILTGMDSLILNVGIFDLARWIGLLSYTTAFVFYLLLGKFLFNNQRVVLLSALPVASMYYVVMVSGFGRMPLSTGLFFMTLFMTFRNYKKTGTNWTLLLVISVAALLFAHPLAPVVLAVFLVFVFLFQKYIVTPSQSSSEHEELATNFATRIHGSTSINFAMIVIVMILAYFTFLSVWSQALLTKTISVLSGTETGFALGTASSTPIYWRVFLYGQAAVGIVLALLVIRGARRKLDVIHLMFLSFALFITFWSLVAYYVRIDFLRFMLFTWPLLLLGSFDLALRKRRRWVVIGIAMSLVVTSSLGYYPATYDKSIIPSQGEWYQYVNAMERAAVVDFPASGHFVGDHYVKMAFLYLRNESVSTDASFFLQGYANPNNYSFFYLDARDRVWILSRETPPGQFPYVSEELYERYQNIESMSRVYDNGVVEVYAILHPGT